MFSSLDHPILGRDPLDSDKWDYRTNDSRAACLEM
jgi:hypothetical protein